MKAFSVWRVTVAEKSYLNNFRTINQGENMDKLHENRFESVGV